MIDIKKTAKFLLNNRFNQQLVDNIPDTLYPLSAEEAYLVQDEVVAHLAEKFNSTPCGYKLACTNTAVMELLNVSGPFTGQMLSHSSYTNGKVFTANNFTRRVVELEFNFVMAEDVPKSLREYTAHTIEPFIGAFSPGVEIVDHRYTDFTVVGGNALIADNAIHGASVVGKRNNDWRSIDLRQQGVSLIVNDQIYSRGTGSNVLGNPLNAMAWLANHLVSRGRNLQAGDTITTGTACDVYYAQAGDKITADFGKLGSVSLEFR